MNLGENIYRLRTEKNLSQGDLAEVLEVSRQSVSKWENNSAVPDLEKLIKMAQIFGITIDELVTGHSKEDVVDTPSPQPQTPPQPQEESQQRANVRQGLSAQQILGIVLAVFGGLCLIVFTAVGIFIGFWLFGLIISMPFILCGTICMLCKKNAGLKCAWAIFIPFWLLCAIMMNR